MAKALAAISTIGEFVNKDNDLIALDLEFEGSLYYRPADYTDPGEFDLELEITDESADAVKELVKSGYLPEGMIVRQKETIGLEQQVIYYLVDVAMDKLTDDPWSYIDTDEPEYEHDDYE